MRSSAAVRSRRSLLPGADATERADARCLAGGGYPGTLVMRFPLASPSALIALGALLGTTAVPLIPSAWAEDQPAQQNAQPKPETSAPAAQKSDSEQPNAKTSGTNDQSGPSTAAPTASQDKQGDQATHSVSGRGGKEEPGSHAPAQDTAVLGYGQYHV